MRVCKKREIFARPSFHPKFIGRSRFVRITIIVVAAVPVDEPRDIENVDASHS